MTSGGNRNPANADFAGSHGSGRVDDFTVQVCLDLANAQRNGATQTYTYNSEWFSLFNSNIASVWNGEKTAAQYTASMTDEMQQMLDKGIAEQKK